MIAAWSAPIIPLALVSDLTAPLWIGFTLLALWLSGPARKASLALIYRSVSVSIGIGVAVGILIGFVLDPLLTPILEHATGSPLDLSQLAELPGNEGALVEWLLVATLFGGIWEEIAFRGFLIGFGVHLFGSRWALPLAIMTSVLFGYGHTYQSLSGAILTGLIGFVFALVYILCDRKLLPAIIAHSVSNIIGVTMIYLHGVEGLRFG